LEASCQRTGISEFVPKPLNFEAFKVAFLGILERHGRALQSDVAASLPNGKSTLSIQQ
jgi:hypothetical protein